MGVFLSITYDLRWAGSFEANVKQDKVVNYIATNLGDMIWQEEISNQVQRIDKHHISLAIVLRLFRREDIKKNSLKSYARYIQKKDILKMINNNVEFIDYLSTLIPQYYYINKEKTYEEAIEKYHQVKDFYYQARQRHYDNVDKSLIPPLNAHLYGDVLVYFNRSISNLVNIVEEITGKDK